MANKAKRTEHAGAKNGGGYRGRRADAKRESAKARREVDRRESVAPALASQQGRGVMQHPQFHIGRVFYTGSGAWVCTDIGTRVIVAVQAHLLHERPMGPPYEWVEYAFDENDQAGCSESPDEFAVRKRMRLVVDRERGKRGVTYGVTSPDAPGAFGVGKTRATAVRDFHGAVELLAEHDAARRSFDDVDALLKHVHMIGHVPGPHEVVFIAEGAMPYVAEWSWLVVAFNTVLGVKLPASVRKAVEKILDAPRSRRMLPPLPVVVYTGGRFTVRAVDLAASCPPPRLEERR
jgi:hypothetical protein